MLRSTCTIPWAMFRSTHPLVRALLLLTLLPLGCSKDTGPIVPDAAFTAYVEAFTTGHVPARTSVLVRLAADQVLRDSAGMDLSGIFRLDPSVEGTVDRVDARTLRFTPHERLEQERTYSVTLDLQRVIDVPQDLRYFRFGFTTIRQGIKATIADLQRNSLDDPRWQRLVFSIRTSDDATGQALSTCFNASQNGRDLHLRWEHDTDGRSHKLTVDSVQRGTQASTIILAYDGKEIASSDAGEVRVELPPTDRMALITHQTHGDGEQYATFLFSDPLDETQDLVGLVGFAGTEDVRYQRDGNKLTIYPTSRLKGEQVAFLSGALRARSGATLGKDLNVDVRFEELAPGVRLLDNGVILPSTDGLVLPFEAVNLRYVEVRIIRIHSGNVSQFLQVNALDGKRELARVGRLEGRHLVPLTTADAPDLGQWNRYHLDLQRYIQAEPGAIYRVSLSFQRAHTALPCAGGPTGPEAPGWSRTWEDERSDHDEAGPSWYYDEDDYYWEEEVVDPCEEQYYNGRRSVSTNLLASDLGIIAKQGNDRSWTFAVTDLRSTVPVSGVYLELRDLQHEVLATVTTDKDGMARIDRTDHAPHLLLARKGEQHGYVRVDPGSSLSVSEFDVEGASIARGLKGFIYGERGVWRPGDSLHLAFMLQQDITPLPVGHPVVLELSDPMGRVVEKLVRTKGQNGTYRFSTATRADAPTGIWDARVTVGGAQFHRTVRIEAIRPNRLKVELKAGPERLSGSGPHPIALHAAWLHGAPARNLRTRVTMTLRADEASFKGYERYVFHDLGHALPEDEQVVFDGTLNAEGDGRFPLNFTLGEASPAMLQANLVTRVFEPGGDASMDRTTITCAPFQHYVGMRFPEPTGRWGSYFTDTTYQVPVVVLTPQGRPVAGRTIIAQVVKMDHSWWWEGGMDGPANYMTSAHAKVRQELALTTDASGRTTFPFRIDRPEWGRFILRIHDPEGGHASAANIHVDWPGWEGRSRRSTPSAAAMLTFTSDRDTYAVGEEATLIIPSSGEGRALVSIESGSRVISSTWVELTEHETRHRFPITADMTPNIHAHVSVIQPHERTRNDLPIRLYGVVPIMVEDASTRIAPIITMAKEVRTDAPFTVEVHEEKGRPMTYTLAIVDEGLLDLTRFRTPDPWSHFHAREALGVRTYDMYDHVIGAYGRQLQRVLALGGSDDGGPVQGAKAQRFKPVVRYVGPFTLAKGAKGRHTFTIDNYVGSVRVMLVATDGHRASGSAERSVPVRKPLMVLASLPRQLSPSEEVDLPITVFAMDRSVKDVRIDVVPDRMFSIVGATHRSVSFSGTGDQVVTFKLRTTGRTGIARVKVNAVSGNERASTYVELDVREPGLPTVMVEEALVPPGEKVTLTYTPLGIAGTNSAQIELSTIPPINMGQRLQYLLDYPHGCLEQTTSKAFPQLYLEQLVQLPGKGADLARSNVTRAIDRMTTFQRSDGSFNYWPEGDQYDAWTSVYAGHFLVEAQRQGHDVPQRLLGPWSTFQRRAAREYQDANTLVVPRSAHQATQAYRLYVLALAKHPEIGAMNRLRERSDLEPRTRWLLAAAYAYAGRTDVARTLTQGITRSTTPYTETGWTYGSGLRDDAIIAEALLAMGDGTGAFATVQRLSTQLSSNTWHSTQSTSFALMAVAHVALNGITNRNMTYRLDVDGKGDVRTTERPIAQESINGPEGRHTLSVHAQGDVPIHVRLIRKGVPQAGEERSVANGIETTVRYEDGNGQAVNVARLEQGQDVFALVTVKHLGLLPDLHGIALTQVFASGWEIRNVRLEGSEASTVQGALQYQDIRDDRVSSYFDLPKGRHITVRIPLQAAFTGRFYLPGASAEAMYDHSVHGRTQGQWVEVVPPGSLAVSE